MLCFSSVSTSCEDCFLFVIHNKHKLKTLKLKIILDDTVKYILIHCPSLLPHRRRLLRNVTSFLGCSRGNKFLTSFYTKITNIVKGDRIGVLIVMMIIIQYYNNVSRLIL